MANINPADNLKSVLALLLAAFVTFVFITVIGAVLRQIGPEKTNYSVLEFRNDRTRTVSTNVLINTFIPNILMVVLFGIAGRLGYGAVERNILLYPAFYYLIRIFIIAVVDNRRELLGGFYTFVISSCGILLALLLRVYFLIPGRRIFIDVDELREEIWFCIIVVIYHFFVLIIQSQFTQRIIVSDEKLRHYIIRMFHKMYAKYAHTLPEDGLTDLHILIFSIMILENYNRGRILRSLEKAKVSVTGCATMGIMQVRTDHIITDEESVIMAYGQLLGCVEINDLPYEVKSAALRYNNSEGYAEAVDYIFHALKDYINSDPSLRLQFYGQDTPCKKPEEKDDNGGGPKLVQQQSAYDITIYSNTHTEQDSYTQCLDYMIGNAAIYRSTYDAESFQINAYLNDKDLLKDVLLFAVDNGFFFCVNDPNGVVG